MIPSRWQLPDDPLRTRAVTAKVAGLVAVVSLAAAVRTTLHLSAAYPVKAAALFAGCMLIAIGYLRAHHGHTRFGSANQITTARAVLVALAVSLIGEQASPPVAAFAAAAGIVVTLLDGVDGWLARRTGMVSAFGARFDLETDALLIQGLAILVWQYGKAGPWVVMSGLLRYLFVVAGWLWPWMQRPLPPSRRGQAICVVQIVALVVAIMPIVTPPAATLVAAFGLLALCYSFLVDTLWLWRHA